MCTPPHPAPSLFLRGWGRDSEKPDWGGGSWKRWGGELGKGWGKQVAGGGDYFGLFPNEIFWMQYIQFFTFEILCHLT